MRRQHGLEAALLAALLLVSVLDTLLLFTGTAGFGTAASVLATLFCLACAVGLRRTVRRIPAEHQVWTAFSRAATSVAIALLAEAGVGMAVEASYLSETWTGAGFSLGAAAFYAFVYQGVVRWNPHREDEIDLGDWINGLAAGLATVALLTIVFELTSAPMVAWPGYADLAWLVNVIALAILSGAAATVANLGGPVRDQRLLAVSVTIGVGAVIEAALGFVAGPALVGATIQVVWVLIIAAVAVCSQARPVTGQVAPAVASNSMVIGALVVLGISIVALALTSIVNLPMPFVTASAVAAALGSGTRLGLLVSSLAQLAESQQEARTDDLTGIANRRALTAALVSVVASGEDCALLVVDLDRFKEINDHHGHAVGDEVLKALALRLQSELPPEAILGRLGGDEFAVLLPGTSADEATWVGWALAEVCASPVDTRAGRLSLRASVGVAMAGVDGRGEGELMRRADTAMYVAKLKGGGVATYDREADRRARKDRDLLEQLRYVLGTDATAEARRQIVVHYQPQLAALSGRVTGAEALVRWEHPTLGLLSPAVFLDLVERHGLMVQMTTHVVQQALKEADRWHRAGHPIRLSVNLAPSVLADPNLLTLVDGAIAESRLDVSHVVLEITETTLMADPERSLGVIRDLAARGIGVSIDDYGTGYSSLAYLHELPAVELKLDRSFTARLAREQRTAAIVASTIDLAHGLGLRLVAEGVEDERTLEVLRNFGCDETQGFLHAKPMRADYFFQWLNTYEPVAHARSVSPVPG